MNLYLDVSICLSRQGSWFCEHTLLIVLLCWEVVSPVPTKLKLLLLLQFMVITHIEGLSAEAVAALVRSSLLIRFVVIVIVGVNLLLGWRVHSSIGVEPVLTIRLQLLI